MDNQVYHPDHYNKGAVECIDALTSAVEGLSGIEAFDTANAIKYLWRWKDKGQVRDLKKAIWYIEHLIQYLEEGSWKYEESPPDYSPNYMGSEAEPCKTCKGSGKVWHQRACAEDDSEWYVCSDCDGEGIKVTLNF